MVERILRRYVHQEPTCFPTTNFAGFCSSGSRPYRTNSEPFRSPQVRRGDLRLCNVPDRRAVGVLFVGVQDNGHCANIEIEDQLLQTLMGYRTDGTILPPPVINVRRHTLDGCTMAIVEVTPSENPLIRYDGRVCIRIGPRRGYATPEEERRLIEKRRWGALPFDQQPMPGATLQDIDVLRFRAEYLPVAVHPTSSPKTNVALSSRCGRLVFLDQVINRRCSASLSVARTRGAGYPAPTCICSLSRRRDR